MMMVVGEGEGGSLQSPNFGNWGKGKGGGEGLKKGELNIGSDFLFKISRGNALFIYGFGLVTMLLKL